MGHGLPLLKNWNVWRESTLVSNAYIRFSDSCSDIFLSCLFWMRQVFRHYADIAGQKIEYSWLLTISKLLYSTYRIRSPIWCFVLFIIRDHNHQLFTALDTATFSRFGYLRWIDFIYYCGKYNHILLSSWYLCTVSTIISSDSTCWSIWSTWLRYGETIPIASSLPFSLERISFFWLHQFWRWLTVPLAWLPFTVL